MLDVRCSLDPINFPQWLEPPAGEAVQVLPLCKTKMFHSVSSFTGNDNLEVNNKSVESRYDEERQGLFVF
jgi:hypothetical protein